MLQHAGFSANIQAKARRALTNKLEQLRSAPGSPGSTPGGTSRWSTKRSAAWEPLAPKLVVEVAYDHFTAGRFRHDTTLLRWRPDKAPRECTLKQVEPPRGGALRLL